MSGVVKSVMGHGTLSDISGGPRESSSVFIANGGFVRSTLRASEGTAGEALPYFLPDHVFIISAIGRKLRISKGEMRIVPLAGD